MTTPERFPDIERVVMDLLASFKLGTVATANIQTETPIDLETRLPFILVVAGTGDDDGLTDYPLVDVEVFAPTRAMAYALAEDIRARLLEAPHRVNGVIIDFVRTTIRPRRLPWANEQIRRFAATYRFSARR